MIKVSDLSMSYGSQHIFDEVGFNINAKEKIGLVGRNGSGKTTLLNLISGKITPENGSITLPKNYTVGYVLQEIDFTEENVLEEGRKGLRKQPQNKVWLVEKILFGLGFTSDDLNRSPFDLSGGFQVRLNLAKVLLSEPDLLLLDEPTNYLDIVAIGWLTRFLGSWQKEMILVTHDRSFMDSICTHIMIIHRKKLRKVRGDTSKIYTQIAKEEEVHEKTRLNYEKREKEIDLFINRFRAKARLAGLVQSRIKSLQKREKLDKLERIESLDFSFTPAPLKARYILSVSGLGFSYTGREPYLINTLSFSVAGRDRIGVIGKNGKGKTTLLRLIHGGLKALNGSVNTHPNCIMGYFGQTELNKLNPHNTIEQELMKADPDHNRKKVMDICASMIFGGEIASKRIGALSGGEKSRVLLGKILLTPANLLLLDEPTNNLDLESCDSLMAAVDSFEGVVIIVTHNELFLHSLVNRLIIFHNDNGRVTFYEGGYQDFLHREGWEKMDNVSGLPKKSTSKNNKRGEADTRRKRAEIVNERSKSLKPFERKIHDTEKLIESLEIQMHEKNRAIIEASKAGEGLTISALSKQHHELQAQINRLYDELEKTLRKHEIQRAVYDEKLEELE
jgi:ATP-binding cassette subfamily F protein 3